MRAYTVPLRSMIVKGLRPIEHSLGNGRYLTNSTNLRPCNGGLREANRYTRSFTLPQDGQIFDCSSGVYVATKSSIYLYSAGNITSLVSTSVPVKRWSFADFGPFILFSNGTINVYRDPVSGEMVLDSLGRFPAFGTICRFRGRVIGGDLSAEGGSESIVSWSDIGKATFLSSSDLGIARKNTAGSIDIVEVGKVLRIVPLGTVGVVVYGQMGIAFLMPVLVDGAAGAMSLKSVLPYGIASENAVVSVGDSHYLLTKYGAVAKLFEKDGRVVVDELDYREFIQSPATAYISFNGGDFKEIIVGMPTDSPFLLGSSLTISNYGAGTVSSFIQDCVYSRTGELIVHSPRPLKQLDAMLTSDILTFDSPGIKEIAQVEILGNIKDSVYVAVSSRVSSSDQFISSDWRLLNSSGAVSIEAAGTEFKLHVAVIDYTEIFINHIAITLSYADKRFLKGARTDYGNKDVAAAGE